MTDWLSGSFILVYNTLNQWFPTLGLGLLCGETLKPGLHNTVTFLLWFSCLCTQQPSMFPLKPKVSEFRGQCGEFCENPLQRCNIADALYLQLQSIVFLRLLKQITSSETQLVSEFRFFLLTLSSIKIAVFTILDVNHKSRDGCQGESQSKLRWVGCELRWAIHYCPLPTTGHWKRGWMSHAWFTGQDLKIVSWFSKTERPHTWWCQIIDITG